MLTIYCEKINSIVPCMTDSKPESSYMLMKKINNKYLRITLSAILVGPKQKPVSITTTI